MRPQTRMAVVEGKLKGIVAQLLCRRAGVRASCAVCGQQQRVLLARALCATRKMLLLDEPVSGLDPKVTAEMYALIQKLNYEDGITVVMISHDLNAALQYASHILHIGDTVFFGTKAAYLNEFPQAWQKGGEVK